MGNDINRKARRAARLAELFTTLYTRALVRAVQSADPAAEARVNAEFAESLTGFVTRGVVLGDMAARIRRNPFVALGLWSALSGDPFEEEREAAKRFCRRWSEFAGVDLSAEDLDLIEAPSG